MILRSIVLGAVGIATFGAAHAQEPQGKSPAGQSSWPHEYLPGLVAVPCLDNDKDNCVWHRLIVDNQTDDTLECSGQLTYDGVNRAQAGSVEHRMVVSSHVRRVVLGDTTNPDVAVKSHDVHCAIRKPPDSSKLTPKCELTVLNAPAELEYPMESRKLSEEGPVLLDFSLTDKDGQPSDIVVVGSSLYPRLDAAGIKYVSEFVGSTKCKHGRFRIPVTFQLK